MNIDPWRNSLLATIDLSLGPRNHIGTGTLDCEFGYTGHFHHEDSDLVLTYFRGYDAELGRWLSPDPLESVTGEMAERLPEGSNLYAYVGNSPTVGRDPTGLQLDIRNQIGNGNQARVYCQQAVRDGNVQAIRMLRGSGILKDKALRGFEVMAQKVRHLMQTKHNLGNLITKHHGGDPVKAIRALENAGAQYCKRKGLTGVQRFTTTIDKRKMVVDGFMRPNGKFDFSTAFFPP